MVCFRLDFRRLDDSWLETTIVDDGRYFDESDDTLDDQVFIFVEDDGKFVVEVNLFDFEDDDGIFNFEDDDGIFNFVEDDGT